MFWDGLHCSVLIGESKNRCMERHEPNNAVTVHNDHVNRRKKGSKNE